MVAALVVVALLLAGLVAGVLTAGAAAVFPALYTLPVGTYITVKQAFDRTYPRIMIPLQLTTLAAETALTTAVAIDGPARSAALAGAAVAATVTSLAVGTSGDVPINLAMESWRPEAPPADWKNHRDRWDRFNVARTVAAVAALVALALAAAVRS